SDARDLGLVDAEEFGGFLLGQAAGLDGPGDLGRELGLALHFRGLGVAQVGVDVSAAFFARDCGAAGHRRPPCWARHAMAWPKTSFTSSGIASRSRLAEPTHFNGLRARFGIR